MRPVRTVVPTMVRTGLSVVMGNEMVSELAIDEMKEFILKRVSYVYGSERSVVAEQIFEVLWDMYGCRSVADVIKSGFVQKTNRQEMVTLRDDLSAGLRDSHCYVATNFDFHLEKSDDSGVWRDLRWEPSIRF